MTEFESIGDERYELAEGPLWCGETQALFWVDIRRPSVHRLRSGSVGGLETWLLPDMVGSIALCSDGVVLAALPNALVALDTVTGELRELTPIEADLPGNRCNDGKCDRAGRFWVGTLQNSPVRDRAGSLYSYDGSAAPQKMSEGLVVPNGIAWSPDDRIMYIADSATRSIFQHDFDRASGRIGPRRLFVDYSERPGVPDGATVDAAGCLWSAAYGGSHIRRYTPGGTLDRVIELPMSQPTSCAFGGPALDVLFVTSAAQRLSPERLAIEPFAGAIITLQVNAQGLSEPRFAGGS